MNKYEEHTAKTQSEDTKIPQEEKEKKNLMEIMVKGIKNSSRS